MVLDLNSLSIFSFKTMKKFILFFAFFSVIIFCFLYSINYIIDKGLRKTGDWNFKVWNDIFDSKINADILIQGNSRAYVHFSPHIIDSILGVNSYNIGYDGLQFQQQYYRYMAYEKYNKLPKVIIQNVDVFTFTKQEKIDMNGLLPHLYDSNIKQILKASGYNEFDMYLLPITKYFGQYSTVIKGSMEYLHIKHFQFSSIKKGYLPKFAVWDGRAFNQIKDTKEKIHSSKDIEIINLFESFLKYCKENNIYVILVYSPQYKELLEIIEDLDEFHLFIKSMANEYGFTYLDYTGDTICIDTTYFYNANHLNATGSEIFSTKVANDIKDIGLLK